MRKIQTTPTGAEPNRFSDMTGYVVAPDEPPTWADALNSLWVAYFALKGNPNRRVPNAPMIEKELRRLRAEYKAGRWNRE